MKIWDGYAALVTALDSEDKCLRTALTATEAGFLPCRSKPRIMSQSNQFSHRQRKMLVEDTAGNKFVSRATAPLMNNAPRGPIDERYEGTGIAYGSGGESAETTPLCCFNHCQEKKICCQKVTWFSFKSKFHAVVWISTSMLMACVLFAIIIPMVFYHLEVGGIHDEIVIDGTDAPSYNLWQSNIYGHGEKRDIFYDLYIFDVDNPVEALRGEKPVLVQRGPYGFMNYFNKFDIHWSDGGDTVQYRLQSFYVFSAERTGPGLAPDDNVTLGYASALGFEYLLQEIPISAQELLDAALTTKINSKLDAIDEIIQTRIQAVIDNPFMDPTVKNETLTKLYRLDTLVTVVEVVCLPLSAPLLLPLTHRRGWMSISPPPPPHRLC
jgi:hypothetical protein